MHIDYDLSQKIKKINREKITKENKQKSCKLDALILYSPLLTIHMQIFKNTHKIIEVHSLQMHASQNPRQFIIIEFENCV